MEVALRPRQERPLPWVSLATPLLCEDKSVGSKGRVCAFSFKPFLFPVQTALSCFQDLFRPLLPCLSFHGYAYICAGWPRGNSLGTVNGAWTFRLECPHSVHMRSLMGTGSSLEWKEEGGELQANNWASCPHAASFQHGAPSSLGILKLKLDVQVSKCIYQGRKVEHFLSYRC